MDRARLGRAKLTRRGVMAGMAAMGAGGLAGCNNGVGSNGAQIVDQRVDATRDYLFDTYPATTELRDKSAGILWMPLITKAGFGFGGSYGTGALRINDVSVDYYQALQANFGFQIGAQQYAHALFFMTDEALAEFRTSAGWAVGADAEYALIDQGENLSADTVTTLDPVIAFVFGQAGLIVGATLEGTKYNRIIP
jgi:lipid-binding SYLF domain-containing protein